MPRSLVSSSEDGANGAHAVMPTKGRSGQPGSRGVLGQPVKAASRCTGVNGLKRQRNLASRTRTAEKAPSPILVRAGWAAA